MSRSSYINTSGKVSLWILFGHRGAAETSRFPYVVMQTLWHRGEVRVARTEYCHNSGCQRHTAHTVIKWFSLPRVFSSVFALFARVSA